MKCAFSYQNVLKYVNIIFLGGTPDRIGVRVRVWIRISVRVRVKIRVKPPHGDGKPASHPSLKEF